MISILLVDDEIASLNGLKNGVDWQKLGIGKVYTAQDAEQARQVFARQAVDLMLCDIEMPRESGLHLMEWVVQNHPGTVFLFYTCHDRFDFVQRALRLGAFDYLLKPFPYGKLEQALYHAFLQALYGGLQDRGIAGEVLFGRADMQAKSLAALQSIEAMKEFVHSAALDAAGAVAQLDNTGSIIDRVKQYIDAHLGDELNRDSLAAHVFIDPAYLSRLFKKETGGLLSEYITERRMEKAKQLLRETDLPVSTIAIHLGYTNMPYFSRSFKKSTGRAPGEYRTGAE